MPRTTEIITINSITDIPSLEIIRAIPRNKKLKLLFSDRVLQQREETGLRLQDQLDGFLVTVHTIEPEINISKLITDKEIEDYQLFFEQCAKDYRNLSTALIYKLAEYLNVSIDAEAPLRTFNPIKRTKDQRGRFDKWDYSLHGIHCNFEHQLTGQIIETPLAFGLEFGGLDPYFFVQFIKTTPEYQPLPVEFFEDYGDGSRINEKMLALGKFENIADGIGRNFSMVVVNKD